MNNLTFEISRADNRLIQQIVNRAARLAEFAGADVGRLDLEMDIVAAHANAYPLDLARLLGAPDLDFIHDVFGIEGHLDRKTGMLRGGFRLRHPLGDAEEREPAA